MTRIGRARIPVMTCCFLSVCHSRHMIVNIFQTVFLDSYLCQITRFQILSWCYQQHLGVITSQLFQNVTSHEAQASPYLISGMEQNISVLFGSDTIFNLFPRKWKQGVGSSRGGAQRGWGVWALNTEHFYVSKILVKLSLETRARDKTMVMPGEWGLSWGDILVPVAPWSPRPQLWSHCDGW